MDQEQWLMLVALMFEIEPLSQADAQRILRILLKSLLPSAEHPPPAANRCHTPGGSRTVMHSSKDYD